MGRYDGQLSVSMFKSGLRVVWVLSLIGVIMSYFWTKLLTFVSSPAPL